MAIQRGNRENVVKVRYTHPSSKASPGQSPGRAVRYLTRRPEHGQDATREAEWSSLPEQQIFGNPEAFREAATERTREIRARYDEGGDKAGKDLSRVKGEHARWCTSYLHIVVSPEGREDYEPEDFAAHIEPWIETEDGTAADYFAAIHYDDPEGAKMHLLVARDRFAARDFQSKLDRADEITEERKQVIEEEREAAEALDESERREQREQERDRYQDLQRDADVDTERTLDDDPGVDGDEERRRDDGLSL